MWAARIVGVVVWKISIHALPPRMVCLFQFIMLKNKWTQVKIILPAQFSLSLSLVTMWAPPSNYSNYLPPRWSGMELWWQESRPGHKLELWALTRCHDIPYLFNIRVCMRAHTHTQLANDVIMQNTIVNTYHTNGKHVNLTIHTITYRLHHDLGRYGTYTN